MTLAQIKAANKKIVSALMTKNIDFEIVKGHVFVSSNVQKEAYSLRFHTKTYKNDLYFINNSGRELCLNTKERVQLILDQIKYTEF